MSDNGSAGQLLIKTDAQNTDQSTYEVTPNKRGNHTGQNSIYNQYVKAGGVAQKSVPNQMEYNQQAPSSYYLLHGKFNGKPTKK